MTGRRRVIPPYTTRLRHFPECGLLGNHQFTRVISSNASLKVNQYRKGNISK